MQVQITNAQVETLKRVRDTGRPYKGRYYRYNVRQAASWQALIQLGLMGRGQRTITPKARALLNRLGV